jgi:2-aminoadipate transaminase
MAAQATEWIDDLYSSRAKLAGPGMVGINPRRVAEVIAFGGGYPDPSSFPIQDILDSARIALERDGEWALQYAPGSGTPELVTELLRKLQRDQGISAAPENVLITNGGSQALGLIWEAFVNPGDAIISEAPFFLGAVGRCESSGADVREVPLDDEGIVISALEHELERLAGEGKRAKFLYLVPNFQNPTGITYTEERRRQIIEIAQAHQLPIVEDDAYHDLRYEGERVPTFYGLDDSGLVMYTGTFSKIISAGMRLGWVIANPSIIAHLSGLKTDFSTNTFTSHIVAEFAGSGTLQEHIGHLKEVYRERRDVMLQALETEMPDGTTWTRPTGGFFIWVTLPEGVSGATVAAEAQQRGVSVGLGTNFYTGAGGERNIRLSYSFNDEDEIHKGIAIIAGVVREQVEA